VRDGYPARLQRIVRGPRLGCSCRPVSSVNSVQLIERKKGATSSFHSMADDRQAWRADVAHDRGRRAHYIQPMKATEQTYTASENEVVARALGLFGAFARRHGRAHTRRLHRPATVDRLQIKHDERSGGYIGEGEAKISGATPEDVVAYLMDVNSRHFQSRLSRELYKCYEVRDVVNEHHSIVFNEMHQAPFQTRTFIVSLIWKRACDDPLTYIFAAASIDNHASVSPEAEAHAVRADILRCVKLTALSSHSTKLEMVTSLDLKGSFPSWFTNAIVLPQVPSRCNQGWWL
jgi:hypothetical protein